MWKIYSSLVLLFTTLEWVNCQEDPCSLWKNDTLMDECCKTISEFDDEEDFSSDEYGKCMNAGTTDYCLVLKCIMEQQGVSVGGKIDSAAMTTTLLAGRNTDEWGKPIEGAVKICSQKMINQECPEDYFLDCLEIVTFLNCPKSMWSESDTCNKVKAALSSCI